jgi:hypothetical protein
MVRVPLTVGVLAFAVLLGACSDSSGVTTPIAGQRVAGLPSFQGGTDTGSVSSGGGTSSGGGGTSSGGGGGGGSSATPCGTLSTAISTYNIVVYTTRIGIGVSGTAYNCGTRKVAFEVDVVDQNPDPFCAVDMPHFIAPKYTDPGMSVLWQVNSTLVNCQNQLHTFNVRLWDTRTGETLGTSTVSAFL